jgi:hypothetical protein
VAHPSSSSVGIVFVPGIKQPRREANHSPSPGAEVVNECSYTSIPLM